MQSNPAQNSLAQDRRHPRTARAARGDRYALLGLFVGLSAVTLLPVWLFPYFPSQDGPAHLSSVSVLMALRAGSPALGTVYTAQWDANTNQLYFLLLQALGHVLPLLTAEKVALTLFAVGLPLASLGAVRLAKGSPYAALLSFPLVYTLPVYMGFFNFCLSLPLFVLVVGLYLAFAEAPAWTTGLGLASLLVLLYLAHIVAAASAVLVVFTATLVRLGQAQTWRDRLRQGTALLTVAPTGCLVLVFLLFFRQTTEASSDLERVGGLARVGDFFSHFFTRVNEPLSLHAKAVYLLDPFSEADRLYTLPLFGLLLALFTFSVVRVTGSRTWRRHLPLFAATCVFGLLLTLAPGRYSSLGWLPGRLLPLTCLVLLLWLATSGLSPAVWRLAAGVAAVVTLTSVAYRLPVHRELNAVTEEYVSAAAVVPAGAVALPLHLGERYQVEGLKPLLPKARFDALEHAAGYASLERPFANLRNFEPARPYFPLQYRLGKDPNLYLSPDEQPARFEERPFHLSLVAYEARTGLRIDYVLVWGSPEARSQPDVAALYDQLDSDYTLVRVSKPKGLMRVYRHRAAPPLAPQKDSP